MRVAILGLALVAMTAGVAPKPSSTVPSQKAAASPSPAPKVVADAPADEYFGPFKYSAISTRTKIDALGRSYRERWQDDASIVHDAGLVQSSLEAWTRKYPKDRWLAPTAFHLAQLYFEIQSPDARSKARAMFEYVAKTYPATKEGHLARVRLRQGFPALHDEPPVTPTTSPYGPAPAASGAPAPSTAPAPESPAAVPAPATPAASTPAPSRSTQPSARRA